MSRTSLEVKAKRKPKFSARAYNRCPLRPRPECLTSTERVCGCFRLFLRYLPLQRGFFVFLAFVCTSDLRQKGA